MVSSEIDEATQDRFSRYNFILRWLGINGCMLVLIGNLIHALEDCVDV